LKKLSGVTVQTSGPLWSSILPWLPIGAFLLISGFANADLSEGRFALFMDERITFDGVRAILHAPNLGEFFFAIGDGDDNRYGRILWYSLALVSWLPELLFGESGQIFASRIFQSVLLAATIWLLTFGLIRTTVGRLAFATVATLIPFTSYYSSMPKPEPLQVFLLALFFYIAFRGQNPVLFGSHWILLGLAFGAKISTIPGIAVILLMALLHPRGSATAKTKFQSALFFLAGLGIAVPILFMPAGLIVAAGFAYQKLDRGKFSHTNYVLTLFTLVASIAIGFQSQVSVWMGQTFFNTGHGADRESTNFFSWLEFLVFEWLSETLWLSLLLIASWGLLAFFIGSKALTPSLQRGHPQFPALLLIATGTALSLSIMLTAQRLWGMYLFPGFLLQLAGIFVFIDSTIFRKGNSPSEEGLSAKVASGLALLATVAITLTTWLPSEISKYADLATRTQSAEYKIELESYLELEKFLDNHRVGSEAKMFVLISPGIFHRESDERYEVIEFFGPYNFWSEVPDLIVLAKTNTPKGPPYPTDSPEYERYLQEQAGYAAQVKTANNDCTLEPCFEVALELANGGQVLVPVR
jgi:4-amino-4-deoxy-L-arabinose transferase-like glycosyltransferase